MYVCIHIYSFTYSHIYIDAYTLFKETRNTQSFLFLLLKALIIADASPLRIIFTSFEI